MKQIQNSLKDLLQRTFIRDGEISITAVMAFLLSILFMHIYVKAEIFGLPFSEIILDKITLVFEIVVIGSAAKAAGRQVAGRIGHQVVDAVNQKRAERQQQRRGEHTDGDEPKSGKGVPTMRNPPPPPVKVPEPVTALADWAKPYLGLQEVPGPSNNPTIMKWIKDMGWERKYPGFDSDEAAWCSLPPNIGAKELGLQFSDSPAAKSWLSVGEPIPVEDVKAGNFPADSGIVAVFHRNYISPNPLEGSGHVAIFEKVIDAQSYQTCEGNLSNSFRRNTRRFDDRMFIEFRLLKPTEA
jgi:hypothetical protein